MYQRDFTRGDEDDKVKYWGVKWDAMSDECGEVKSNSEMQNLGVFKKIPENLKFSGIFSDLCRSIPDTGSYIDY
jgi:hypothetical protein